TLTGADVMVFDGDFSPDGKAVALAEWDRTVRLLDSHLGKELQVLRGHLGRVRCVRFAPGGQLLASGDEQPGEVKVWDLSRPPEYSRVQGPVAKPAEALAIDSQSQLLLYVVPKHGLGVYDLRTGQATTCPLKLLEEPRAPGQVANFSGDGRR